MVGECQSYGADHVINWEEFTAKFRKAHIPTGLIKMKRDEFFNLKQNNSNVVEYLEKFNTLARDPEYLVAVPYPDLEALVDAAIMVESKRKAAYETRKRKMQQQQSGPSNPKFRSPPPSRPSPSLREPQPQLQLIAPTTTTPIVQLLLSPNLTKPEVGRDQDGLEDIHRRDM
ncbi:hypothetical protein QYE76_065726 [Lolium multiflorum]|uniref:Retrotransposon gag domain-containing protein n=1 Tax=Lolium multiflorum TaxID=4521 RepID=A0AAD8SAM7_LOLMU|nr:hypothetical protein QYE76_065726 [Lolium multiflorum]